MGHSEWSAMMAGGNGLVSGLAAQQSSIIMDHLYLITYIVLHNSNKALACPCMQWMKKNISNQYTLSKTVCGRRSSLSRPYTCHTHREKERERPSESECRSHVSPIRMNERPINNIIYNKCERVRTSANEWGAKWRHGRWNYICHGRYWRYNFIWSHPRRTLVVSRSLLMRTLNYCLCCKW